MIIVKDLVSRGFWLKYYLQGTKWRFKKGGEVTKTGSLKLWSFGGRLLWQGSEERGREMTWRREIEEVLWWKGFRSSILLRGLNLSKSGIAAFATLGAVEFDGLDVTSFKDESQQRRVVGSIECASSSLLNVWTTSWSWGRDHFNWQKDSVWSWKTWVGDKMDAGGREATWWSAIESTFVNQSHLAKKSEEEASIFWRKWDTRKRSMVKSVLT